MGAESEPTSARGGSLRTWEEADDDLRMTRMEHGDEADFSRAVGVVPASAGVSPAGASAGASGTTLSSLPSDQASASTLAAVAIPPAGEEPHPATPGGLSTTSLAPIYTGPTIPFRPEVRPPTAILKILDDNQKSGELIRLRSDRCLIGRVEGDVVLPHDGQLSSRHAEIVRVFVNGRYRWLLRDLKSYNGVFVRIDGILLKDGDELLIGRCNLRFMHKLPADQAEPAFAVEIRSPSHSRLVPLDRDEYWIGRDVEACQEFVLDDSAASRKHARLTRAENNRWRIVDHQSTNGVWARVAETPLAHGCWFQLGEQRFRWFLS